MDWSHRDGRGKPQADVPVKLLAVAAIEAMREPTEAMVEAGKDDWDDGHSASRWRDMIDAGLPSPPDPA